ncbi:MAG: GNAT family N-acetyltransferase [Micavibrio sp.]|nr:GNAT family N-acetyltransferase [Micavibrio sp.]
MKEQFAGSHEEGTSQILIEALDRYEATDLGDLCDATESTLEDNRLSFSIGMDRTEAPARQKLEAYWKGVLLVPERKLIVGRLDTTIASSIQLVKPAPSNQTSAFAGFLDHHFVAPWARGFGLAKGLIEKAEEEAKKENLSVLRLSVRANLDPAIAMYESVGYKRWGTLDQYELVDGQMLAGHFYVKEL